MTTAPGRKKTTAAVKKKAKYLLRLYVTGTTGKSVRAIQNVRRICEKHLKDLYDLEPEEAKNIPTVCHSLDMALESLDKDRGFLKEGGVFTDDVIDAYMGLKMQEVTRLRMSTHPVELELYYSV